MESRISGHTKLFCLIGSPVGHSGSPAMYNYTFERLGIDAAYLAFDIPLEQVEAGVEALKTLGVGGFNVTMPDKTAVSHLVDELSPAAKLIGACNTVTVDETGKLTGHNTDGVGFVRNLHEHGVELAAQCCEHLNRALIVERAVAVQTALDGAAEIAIFNRTGYDFYANGELTVQKLAEAVPNCKVSIHPLQDKEALAEAVKHCDILVNATKVGMKPLEDQSLIDPSLFRPDLVVADTVYNPRETRMIQEAKAAGCKIAVGGMLLWQGVAAFKLYTGKDMPAQEVLEKFFS